MLNCLSVFNVGIVTFILLLRVEVRSNEFLQKNLVLASRLCVKKMMKKKKKNQIKVKGYAVYGTWNMNDADFSFGNCFRSISLISLSIAVLPYIFATIECRIFDWIIILNKLLSALLLFSLLLFLFFPVLFYHQLQNKFLDRFWMN